MVAQRVRQHRTALVIFVLLTMAAGAYFIFRVPDLGTRESLNILIVGIDGVVTYETTPSAPLVSAPTADAIALLSLHPKDRTAHSLLLPGEISVAPDPDDPLAAYSLERPLYRLVDGHGADSLVQFVETALDVPVHHVIRIDSLSLTQLVDRVGGLTLANDTEGGDMTNRVHFTGAQAYSYLKSAAEAGEAERMRAQYAIYEAALTSIRAQSRLVHLAELFRFGRRHLETDLGEDRLYAVAKHLYEVPDGGIRIEVLPGHFDTGEYRIDWEALGDLVERTYKNRERPSGRAAP